MSRVTAILILGIVGCGGTTSESKRAASSDASRPPPARVVSVMETKFGVRLSDPYRWMEKPENRKELHAWLRAQGAYTRRKLDRIRGLSALRTQLRRLNIGASTVGNLQRRGARLFYTATAKGESVARLYVRDPTGRAQLLFDPTTERGKERANIDNYTASPDGKLVAVNVSHGGSEITTIRVIEVATGRRLPDSAGPVWGEFRVSWLPDITGFFYTQMRAEALENSKLDKMKNWNVRLHVLGKTSEDRTVVLGPGVAPTMPIAPKEFPVVRIPLGSRWAFALATGARASARLAVARVADLGKRPVPWKMIAEYSDQISRYAVRGDDLFVLTTKNAPNGRVLKLDLNNPSLARASELVPESSRVIRAVGAAKNAVWTVELVAGSGGLRSIDGAGRVKVHTVPGGSALRLAVADPGSDEVLLGLRGWAQPFGYVSATRARKTLAPIGLSGTSPADFSKTVVKRVSVPSTGGAMVPMTILHNRGSPMKGKRPTIVGGYGAYGITVTPFHYPALQAWLERGGVYAICNVRGGGAKGRAWHLAGKGAKKANGVRDFVNCARYLVKQGYTVPERVAAIGFSMGAVLVGRAITETPEAFGAARISAGFLNVTRILAQENGANQIAELGDPRTEAGFKAVLNMDVYHNVDPGRQYPAIILPIGLNDNRVAPWMTAKFAARMQASGTRAPVLIRVEDSAGHAVGSTRVQASDKTADTWAFFLHRFGLFAAL